MCTMSYILERWGEADRQAVIDIFNHYIQRSLAAFPDEMVDYDFFDVFLGMSRDYPAVAVHDDGGQTVGFAFLRAFHPAGTFRRTAEVAWFIHPDHTRRGLGRRMWEYLAREAPGAGVSVVLASISSLNEPSLSFHRKQGFREVGRLPGVGRKFGQDFDVIIMQRNI